MVPAASLADPTGQTRDGPEVSKIVFMKIRFLAYFLEEKLDPVITICGGASTLYSFIITSDSDRSQSNSIKNSTGP